VNTTRVHSHGIVANESIDKKLGATFNLAIIFSVLVTTIGFTSVLLFYSYQSFTQELTSITNVVGATSRGALAFNDAATGSRILSALSAKPAIRYAALHDSNGNLVSEFKREKRYSWKQLYLRDTEYHWSLNEVQVSAPVTLESDVVGTITVISSIDSLFEQLAILVVTSVLLVIITILGAFRFRKALRRTVSGPIITLRDMVEKVSATQDFSSRLPQLTHRQDEIKALITSFNQMLEQIEVRDKALVHAKERAEEADRLKSSFLATVSHELRTPLHTIIGLTEEVLHTAINAEQEELLQVVRSSGGHLISIINDILDFSKIEAGKLLLLPLESQVEDCVLRIIQMFELSARKKNITLSYTIDSTVPKTVIVDPGRLTQILVNLTSNAIRYTTEGGVTIAVTPGPAHSDPQKVILHFAVTDTGTGIPKEQQSSLFQSFTQLRRAGEIQEGTGLGLAISSRLVTLMGGKINVVSDVGCGSTFYFTIDAKKAPTKSVTISDASNKIETPENISHLFNGAAPTILIVEDNKVNSKLAERLLLKCGYKVLTAFNGQECLDILAQEHVDLILMDINMPVMDGMEATKIIRAQEREQGLPKKTIIALTANALDDNTAACQKIGMDEYIIKPFERTVLLQIIQRYLTHQ
jgi:signal transduction histidine kinase/CheY-like chemotaxis protein